MANTIFDNKIIEAKAKDLLTGAEYTFPLTAHTPICLTLPAWKGVILKIK